MASKLYSSATQIMSTPAASRSFARWAAFFGSPVYATEVESFMPAIVGPHRAIRPLRASSPGGVDDRFDDRDTIGAQEVAHRVDGTAVGPAVDPLHGQQREAAADVEQLRRLRIGRHGTGRDLAGAHAVAV